MIDYVTTEGKLIMSADDDCCNVHQKGDVLCFEDGATYVVMQRTWQYSKAGIEVVNPLNPNKRTSNVKASMQIILQEVIVDAGPRLLS